MKTMKFMYNLILLSILLLCYNQTRILSQAFSELETPKLISFEGASAFQSSTLEPYRAENPLKDDDSFNHTGYGLNQWWKVELPKYYQIKKIRIRNRFNCCGERLTGAQVFVGTDKTPVFTFPKTKNGEWKEITLNKKARVIKIVSAPNIATHIHISNIQVFGEEIPQDPIDKNKINLEGAIATQSTIGWGLKPENALKNDKSFQCTQHGYNQWWKVVLPKMYRIQKIRILNRIDCPHCGHELTGAQVFVGYNENPVYTFPKTESAEWYEINLNQLANQIKIVTAKGKYTLLHFSQIQVFGEETNEKPVYKTKKISFEEAKASQSSVLYGYQAFFALQDNDKINHTKIGRGQWWKVIFSRYYKIEKIRIQNVVNNPLAASRLSKTQVFVGSCTEPVYTFPEKAKSGEWYEFNLNVVANEVRIVTSEYTYLHFSRIEVFGKETDQPNPLPLPCPDPRKDLFPGAIATQSSTDHEFKKAENALKSDNSFAATKKGKGEWWKVTFPKYYKVEKIRIRNTLFFHADFLSRSQVFVGNCNKPAYIFPDNTKRGEWYEFKLDTAAKEVKIVTIRNVELQISRFEIYGQEIEQPDYPPRPCAKYNRFRKLLFKDAIVTQSSELGICKAENSLHDDNTVFRSKYGRGNWWRVVLAKWTNIKRIKIKNIKNSRDIIGANLYVGEELVYTFPSTGNLDHFDINVNITHKEIKIVKDRRWSGLSFQYIEIIGEVTDIEPIRVISFAGSHFYRSSDVNCYSHHQLYELRHDLYLRCTKKGIGEWWNVIMPKYYNINKIRIRSRVNCPSCGPGLAGAKVLVDRKHIYTFPSQTESGKWYEINNINMVANDVKIVTTRNDYLHINHIQIYGKSANPLPHWKNGQKGECVDSNNHKFTNWRFKQLKAGEFNTPEKIKECLKLCSHYTIAGGCEIVSGPNAGCYVHRSRAVVHGNNKNGHTCYPRRLDAPPKTRPNSVFHRGKHKGRCLDIDRKIFRRMKLPLFPHSGLVGTYKNEIEKEMLSDKCHEKCLLVNKASGCEFNWINGNGYCYYYKTGCVHSYAYFVKPTEDSFCWLRKFPTFDDN